MQEMKFPKMYYKSNFLQYFYDYEWIILWRKPIDITDNQIIKELIKLKWSIVVSTFVII